MALWIEISVRYDKMQENGMIRKTTEKYLFDALTFSDAEARAVEKLTPHLAGEFGISATKKTRISEIIYDSRDFADKWYLVKINWITIDEKSGKEKKSANLMLVQANNFYDAYSNFKDAMKGTLGDYEIFSITETPYMDVYPYEYKQDEEKSE